LSAISVREGDEVADGQAVGRAGQSGRATGPHVHLELTRNNERLDPGPLVRAAEFKKVAVVAD
jgi:murein DD-endopeptidase MepM/ murein hydrolase activator NlpD